MDGTGLEAMKTPTASCVSTFPQTSICPPIAFAALAFPCAPLYARTVFWVLPAALLLGGAIELIQPYLGRDGEWADFVADVIGIGCGIALGLTIRAIRLKGGKHKGLYPRQKDPGANLHNGSNLWHV